MFNIGAGEMILIALVLLIAVGPDQLPGVIRRTGRVVGQLKTMSDNLRRDFNSSLDEIERAADVKSWTGADFESTIEAVKDAATEPFKTDLGVDGSTKVSDMWSRPAAAADAADVESGQASADTDGETSEDAALAEHAGTDDTSDDSELTDETIEEPAEIGTVDDDATDEVA